MWRKALFLLLIVFCLTPYASPPIALVLGSALALTVGNPFPSIAGKPTNFLLQASVVLLGFGMDLGTVWQAGKQGILFTAVTIAGTLLLGYVVGRLLKVNPRTSTLISAGTAICGGSAIAAISPVIDAERDEITLSMGTIFVLNSAALLLFPVIGRLAGMSPHEFGTWSAIAIHDTSSVVGAASTFGQEALATATTVKLVRALWIAPVALALALIYHRKNGSGANIAVPWFVLLFLLATAIRSYEGPFLFPSIFEAIVNLARAGLTATLFLIGVSLSRAILQKFGYWALLQGVILWVTISVVSFWAVRYLL